MPYSVDILLEYKRTAVVFRYKHYKPRRKCNINFLQEIICINLLLNINILCMWNIGIVHINIYVYININIILLLVSGLGNVVKFQYHLLFNSISV